MGNGILLVVIQYVQLQRRYRLIRCCCVEFVVCERRWIDSTRQREGKQILNKIRRKGKESQWWLICSQGHSNVYRRWRARWTGSRASNVMCSGAVQRSGTQGRPLRVRTAPPTSTDWGWSAVTWRPKCRRIHHAVPTRPMSSPLLLLRRLGAPLRRLHHCLRHLRPPPKRPISSTPVMCSKCWSGCLPCLMLRLFRDRAAPARLRRFHPEGRSRWSCRTDRRHRPSWRSRCRRSTSTRSRVVLFHRPPPPLLLPTRRDRRPNWWLLLRRIRAGCPTARVRPCQVPLRRVQLRSLLRRARKALLEAFPSRDGRPGNSPSSCNPSKALRYTIPISLSNP